MRTLTTSVLAALAAGTAVAIETSATVANTSDVRPVPNAVQLERHADGQEIIGIVHWGLNTFYDREWGNGDEDPARLDPSDFDADQIVRACKDGGIVALTVVAKHHDGFCLWPTKTTGHNITKSPFRGGKGDYVREMCDACARAGVRFGVYCSPWDRNNAEYARPAYVKTFHEQVRELTDGRYGRIFLMWFDGANGGTGWYGGANERRSIPVDYYRFDELIADVRARQPGVGVFGGQGRGDFRWPGNEQGLLCDESRATTLPEPGDAYRAQRASGTPDGSVFRPAEADFPLRKGWFYHDSERGRIRHAPYLMKIYLGVVGNAGSMEIGIAPDRRGRLDDEDVRALRGFSDLRRAFFANEVTEDGKPFNVVVMREDICGGEQVDGWEFVADGRTVLSGRSIGAKRIRTLPEPIAPKTCAVRITRRGPGHPFVSVRRYYVDPELEKLVRTAESTCGETDTAKWMKAGIQHRRDN